MRHAKIVCTIGPATAGVDNLCKLVHAGMDVARLNFSHSDHQHHEATFHAVREASEKVGKPVAILADLCGPKIRLGDIEHGQVEIAEGDDITITTAPIVGDARRVSTVYLDLPRDVEPGVSIFVDDGYLELVVERVEGEEVHCKVKTGGLLKSRKGLNIPHSGLSAPALTAKDVADLEFGKRLGVDFFAISFVRRPSDVQQAKQLAGDIPVIAKIEKPEAIDVLEEIADVCDGMMVARGDLGVEVGFEKVPLLQKRIIEVMNHRAKPVITATQMLESMLTNPRPTRAEVSDVANAVLDGTDAVMLSAESAVGKYPFAAVRTMSQIIQEVETSAFRLGMIHPRAEIKGPDFASAIAHSAARTALELDLKAVVVYSVTGRSIAYVSAYRPHCPIAAFSENHAVLRRSALRWGVRPVYSPWVRGVDGVVRQSEEALIRHGLAAPGDRIAITFGMEDGGPVGTTVMKLWTIRDSVATS